jgi:hypothetical protein
MEDRGIYDYLLAGHRVTYTLEIGGTSGTNSWESHEVTVDGVDRFHDDRLNLEPGLFGELTEALGERLEDPTDPQQQRRFFKLLAENVAEDGETAILP